MGNIVEKKRRTWKVDWYAIKSVREETYRKGDYYLRVRKSMDEKVNI